MESNKTDPTKPQKPWYADSKLRGEAEAFGDKLKRVIESEDFKITFGSLVALLKEESVKASQDVLLNADSERPLKASLELGVHYGMRRLEARIARALKNGELAKEKRLEAARKLQKQERNK